MKACNFFSRQLEAARQRQHQLLPLMETREPCTKDRSSRRAALKMKRQVASSAVWLFSAFHSTAHPDILPALHSEVGSNGRTMCLRVCGWPREMTRTWVRSQGEGPPQQTKDEQDAAVRQWAVPGGHDLQALRAQQARDG